MSKRILRAALVLGNDNDWGCHGGTDCDIKESFELAQENSQEFGPYEKYILEIELPEKIKEKAPKVIKVRL